MNIAFIPIDNRPVCYNLPFDISKSGGVNLLLPEREYLGNLVKPCNIDKIFEWLEGLCDIDAVVISLDTVAYGGLITSRRTDVSFDVIKNRLMRLKDILKGNKIYAFSSIMRISNNNINIEEKEYWSDYGKKIFEYSYNLHKYGNTDTDIPREILSDYLETRKRNFEINKIYLDWQKEGFFETLIFSKDDCAEYGLNVMEAEELQNLGGYIKTGADEIPLTLLARAVNDYRGAKIKVSPFYTEPDCKNLISNYEDISIEKCVTDQLNLAGCEISNYENADIILYVNNFRKHQGEIVMGIATEQFTKSWLKPDKPYIIADVRNANGADNEFVKQLFEHGSDKNFCGYGGWNTSANMLGSLICAMVLSYKNRCEEEFQKLQVIRLADDWAYQANVRQMLKEPDEELCKTLMKPYEEKIWEFFGKRYDIKYKFPWGRLFEVEIEFS